MSGQGVPDRIQLRGLRATGVHGMLPEEQVRAQPFELDIDLELDLSRAGVSDRLEDTVDYAEVTSRALGIVQADSYRLLERLAQAVADAVLETSAAQAVTVALRKLRPAVPGDLRSAGVLLRRRAPAGAHGGPGVPEAATQAGSGARRRAFLGLGSNLGDRRGFLRSAVAALPDLAAVSPVYETDPVGGPAGQGPYLNLVAELRTALPARALLALAQRLEAIAGRVREERWGPRTLDVDILLVGDEVSSEEDLVVPHPRLAERPFVLAPLADLAPEVVGALVPGFVARDAEGVRPAGEL